MADAHYGAEAGLATLDPPLGGAGPVGAAQNYKAQIGRFVILHQLGAGGMGTVFAAYDEQLDRKVALKLLHTHSMPRERQHQRTLREAKALARVTHPRVVSVYEVGESAHQVYLAMELIDGITLRKWQAHPRSWRELLQMYLHAGAGLRAAHQANVVHCDFKPENVLVGKDQLPRVVDFGIAYLSALQTDENPPASDLHSLPNPRVTFEGAVIGTVGYISPEQYESSTIDAKSDQWSFCAALYEALYGYLPFAGTTAAEQAVHVRGALRPPPPGSEVPQEIFLILSRGLSHAPGARFPDMAAVLDRLAAEYEQSARAEGLSRGTIVALVATATLCMWLVAQYLLFHHAQLRSYSIVLSMGLVTTALLAGYRFRTTLRRNHFHRTMWALFLIAFLQNLGVRIVFALRQPPLPSGLRVAVEMLVWVGTSLLMTLLLLPRMWWACLFPVGVAVLAVASEPAPQRLLLCAYPIIVALLLWHWLDAARRHGSDPR